MPQYRSTKGNSDQNYLGKILPDLFHELVSPRTLIDLVEQAGTQEGKMNHRDADGWPIQAKICQVTIAPSACSGIASIQFGGREVITYLHDKEMAKLHDKVITYLHDKASSWLEVSLMLETNALCVLLAVLLKWKGSAVSVR